MSARRVSRAYCTTFAVNAPMAARFSRMVGLLKTHTLVVLPTTFRRFPNTPLEKQLVLFLRQNDGVQSRSCPTTVVTSPVDQERGLYHQRALQPCLYGRETL